MSALDTALDVIAKVSGMARDELKPEMELVGNLGLDSAKALELLVELEDQLDMEIGDDEAAQLNTVGDILDYVKKLSTDPA
jgi:acyl carrier protein